MPTHPKCGNSEAIFTYILEAATAIFNQKIERLLKINLTVFVANLLTNEAI